MEAVWVDLQEGKQVKLEAEKRKKNQEQDYPELEVKEVVSNHMR